MELANIKVVVNLGLSTCSTLALVVHESLTLDLLCKAPQATPLVATSVYAVQLTARTRAWFEMTSCLLANTGMITDQTLASASQRSPQQTCTHLLHYCAVSYTNKPPPLCLASLCGRHCCTSDCCCTAALRVRYFASCACFALSNANPVPAAAAITASALTIPTRFLRWPFVPCTKPQPCLSKC